MIRKLITLAAAVSLATGLAACSGTAEQEMDPPVEQTVEYHISQSLDRAYAIANGGVYSPPATGDLSYASGDSFLPTKHVRVLRYPQEPITVQIMQNTTNAYIDAYVDQPGWVECWIVIDGVERDRQRATGITPHTHCWTPVVAHVKD